MIVEAISKTAVVSGFSDAEPNMMRNLVPTVARVILFAVSWNVKSV